MILFIYSKAVALSVSDSIKYHLDLYAKGYVIKKSMMLCSCCVFTSAEK